MKCKGITKAGKPCIRDAKDKEYCWQHRPLQAIITTKEENINHPINLPIEVPEVILKLQDKTILKEETKEEIKKDKKKEGYLPLRLIDKGCSNVFLIIYKGRYMALKEICCDKLFKNEIQILKTLSEYPEFHKNIVGMYLHSHKKSSEGFNRIFLEYVEGVSLQKLLKMGSVPEHILDFIIEKSLQTLKYIHSKKIVHRDIKLENIIFGLNSLKFIDFGLATYINGNIICSGTPNYISPELWEYSQQKDAKYKNIDSSEFLKKVDVYALGVAFYILLNRKYPFITNHKDELKKMIVNSPSIISKSGTKYDELVNKMLTKNYKDRPFIDDCNL